MLPPAFPGNQVQGRPGQPGQLPYPIMPAHLPEVPDSTPCQSPRHLLPGPLPHLPCPTCTPLLGLSLPHLPAPRPVPHPWHPHPQSLLTCLPLEDRTSPTFFCPKSKTQEPARAWGPPLPDRRQGMKPTANNTLDNWHILISKHVSPLLPSKEPGKDKECVPLFG